MYEHRNGKSGAHCKTRRGTGVSRYSVRFSGLPLSCNMGVPRIAEPKAGEKSLHCMNSTRVPAGIAEPNKKRENSALYGQEKSGVRDLEDPGTF